MFISKMPFGEIFQRMVILRVSDRQKASKFENRLRHWVD